jgi:antitoxin (DNA-binding transcriptional repressor) of toxin-antitoxin stability system
MKTLTVQNLNRHSATVLEAVERGETFALRRQGKTVAYLTRTPPQPECKPDWTAHFEWLKKQKPAKGGFVEELEEERRRLRAREMELENRDDNHR